MQKVRIKVAGVAYDNISENAIKLMPFVQKSIANGVSQITIDNISQAIFQDILDSLALLNYDIKEPAKIKNDDLESYIGKPLAIKFGKMGLKKINQLYKAAKVLEMTSLRKCIAAAVVCWSWFEPTLESYNKKAAEINLKVELTTQMAQEYKKRYSFMN